MKDKTHDMNRGYTTEEAENGFTRLPRDEMSTVWDRKKRQLKWANLEDNKGLLDYEGVTGEDEDWLKGGFLPRNDYERRS